MNFCDGCKLISSPFFLVLLVNVQLFQNHFGGRNIFPLTNSLNFYMILRAIVHLQLLQNIGYTPHLVHPCVYLIPSDLYLHSPTPILPSLHLPTRNCWFVLCIYECLSSFVVFTSLLDVLDPTYECYNVVFVFDIFPLITLPPRSIHVAVNGTFHS